MVPDAMGVEAGIRKPGVPTAIRFKLHAVGMLPAVHLDDQAMREA